MHGTRSNPNQPEEQQPAVEQEEASWYQWPLYTWVSPLLARGSARIKEREFLTEDDLLELPEFEDPIRNAAAFTPFWEEEVTLNPKKPDLVRALRKAFGTRIYIGGCFRFVSDFSAFAAPFLLQQFIRWLMNSDAPKWEGFVWAAALTLANVIMSSALNAGSHHTITGFQQMSTALMVKIYDAALEHPLNHGDTGTLTQAHSLDTGKFIEMAMFVHGLWVSPVLVLCAVVAMYFFIGYAGLVAVGLMIFFIPIQSIFMGVMMVHQRHRLGAAKSTIGSVNEALQGIRIIKFMNWEVPKKSEVAGNRAKEVESLKVIYFFKSLTQVLMHSTPMIILFVTFLVAAKLGEPITADTVFPTLAMINVIRVPLMFIPMSISKLFELQFSLDRITGVLIGGRTDPISTKGPQDAANAVEVKNVTVYTKDDKPLMTFEDVQVPKGKLTMIVGPTGSGKTTLVSTMLGEVKVAPNPAKPEETKEKKPDKEEEKEEEKAEEEELKEEPKEPPFIAITGGVAYVPQEPWLMNATVEKNITMQEEYQLDRYTECLHVCQLMADIEQLDGGDETQVGERGITLSGGQKQRISLARAAYSSKDIVIMDDPLSAVDPEVRRGLFFECISEWMNGKTRVLVTHQTQFLPYCDQIIHVDADHKVLFQGSYPQYVEAGHVTEEAKSAAASPASPSDLSPTPGAAKDERKKQFVKKTGKALDSVEENALGVVSWDVYGWYCRQGGWFWVVLFSIGLLVWRTATVFVDLWLTWWSSRSSPFGYHYEENDYIMWFGLSILISMILLYIRMEFFRRFILGAAEHTHATLMNSLMYAPVSFYDTTPMGRILNRCSKDIEIMDSKIPEVVLMVCMMAFMILGMLVVVSISTPYFLVFIPFLGIAYRWIYTYYAYTVRGLKRLEGSSRSPFMSMMNETIGGLATIRAFNCGEQFSKEHQRRSQVAMRPVYCTRACQRWIASRTEFMGSGILLVTSMLAAMSHVIGPSSWNTQNDPGLVALAVTYAMITTNTITWLTRMMAELESDMSSTERVKEYSDAIPQEKMLVYANTAEEGTAENPAAPTKEWPTQGAISFENVELRYRDQLPLVLKGICLDIQGGQKIGVVGRTGSGKSTIMLALFRMVELAAGSIRLDGHDISSLTMEDLRKNITIIPQDPTLFAGTVRKNLDPFGKFDDETLWKILDQVNLKKRVESAATKEKKKNPVAAPSAKEPTTDVEKEEKEEPAKPTLDAPVEEKGSNFSVGERQLMCLARALLKKSKILLLDEATASVDFEADELIQRTIRDEFAECTVLTIAHRLATVIDSDKLLVLNDGLVAEFDSPKNLLSNPESIFTSMAAQLGETQFEDLKEKANNKQ